MASETPSASPPSRMKKFSGIIVALLVPCLIAEPTLCNFGFWISDFGSNTKSEIQNPKSKMSFGSPALQEELVFGKREPLERTWDPGEVRKTLAQAAWSRRTAREVFSEFPSWIQNFI